MTIITPQQFLEDYTRDIAEDRANTAVIMKGYIKTMEARDEALRKQACAEMGASFFDDPEKEKEL